MSIQPPYTTIYDLDYFSGSQCFLYIGDVWVDEVTSLQFSCNQDKRPIYGYASQLFDDTSAGHVLVQGAFTINFKEQGYLWYVLQRYKLLGETLENAGLRSIMTNKTSDSSGKNNKSLTKKGIKAALNSKTKGGDKPIIGSNGTYVSRATIERVVQGNLSTQEKYEFYNDLAGYATQDLGSPKDKTFEDIVEAFEDTIWDPVTNDASLNSQIRRTDDNYFDKFDMYVVFGNYAVPGVNHTVTKIIGVRLLTQGKVITTDGNPIQESYEFIAQSIA